MREEEAMAICMGCFKGSKTKPENLLRFATACRVLLGKWGIQEMSARFNVSKYQIRQVDKINDLEPEFKELARKSHTGIEMFYHIWRLKEPKRSQFAKTVQDMNSDDIRTLMYFIRKNPSLSVAECKKLVDKTKPEEVNVLVVPLDRQTYDELGQSAKKSGMKMYDYVIKIIRDENDRTR